METEKLFADKADLYAVARPMYPQALFDFISSITNGRDRAWDCASGNGQAAVGLVKSFSKVYASDISHEQIANAFQSPNIEYSVQAAENTNYMDHQFDLVNVAQALHWFDYEKYWDEVSRVLNPRGVFVAYSYIWPAVNNAVDDVVEQSLKKIIEPYWASNNRIVWDGYKTVDFPFKRLATPDIDLTNQWDLHQFVDYLHTWSATRRCMEEIGDDFFNAAKENLTKVWGDPNTKMTIKNPLTIIAGNAW